jgi:hypothetical protein
MTSNLEDDLGLGRSILFAGRGEDGTEEAEMGERTGGVLGTDGKSS